MNNLNSILIEGVLKENAQFRETSNGTNLCTIVVVNNRFYLNEGMPHEAVSHFTVEVSGKLGDVVLEKGVKGRGVRVVGWLKEEERIGADKKSQSRIIIVAEHVEFRQGLEAVEKTAKKPLQKKKGRKSCS